MKFKQAKKHTIQCMGHGISLNHDLNHDLTFYCIHNQLWMPQYKVNVQSTWDIKLWPLDYSYPAFSSHTLLRYTAQCTTLKVTKIQSILSIWSFFQKVLDKKCPESCSKDNLFFYLSDKIQYEFQQPLPGYFYSKIYFQTTTSAT